MSEMKANFTRRQTLAGLGGTSALALLPGCAVKMGGADGLPGTSGANAADLKLDDIAYRMLAHEPGRATGLGVDTGPYADWRGTFGTPGQEGLDAYRSTLQTLRDEARAYPTQGLTADQQIGFEVIDSAFSRALDGMALPYGDVAVGSWRNAPYVVIQNVGAYLDMPRFFGATQPLSTGEDAEYFILRLREVTAVLMGELERMQAARAHGVIPPDFLLDKAIAQMETTLAAAGKRELFVADMRPRLAEAGLPERYARLAEQYVAGPILLKKSWLALTDVRCG